MDVQRILLGDWSPVVRDPIDVLRIGYVCAAIAFASVEHASLTNLAVSSAAVIAIRFVELPRLYEIGFLAAMTLTGWGDALGLYDRFRHFDNLVHLLVPFVIAPIVYVLLARLDVLPDLRDRDRERRHHMGIFVVTLALGSAIGSLWEVFEWSADHTLGSHLVRGETDTVTDLVADTCGAAAGALLLVAWSVFGWGTERRERVRPTRARGGRDRYAAAGRSLARRTRIAFRRWFSRAHAHGSTSR